MSPFTEPRKYKVGDLVQDIFTKEFGLIIEIYFIESLKPIYRILLQNPEYPEYPIVNYSEDSIWMICCVSENNSE